MNQNKLEQHIETAIVALDHSLVDSPKSFNWHLANHIGFYQGFCSAKDWETNLGFINRLERLKMRIK